MKFLVLWRMNLGRRSPDMALRSDGCRGTGPGSTPRARSSRATTWSGHTGGHGSTQVGSHEELERLLGTAPVFNFATYEVIPLADMDDGLGSVEIGPEA